MLQLVAVLPPMLLPPMLLRPAPPALLLNCHRPSLACWMGRCRNLAPFSLTPPTLPAQVPVTAVGAAETAAERHAASEEAQLASVGDVGEWTVLQQPGAGADLAPQNGQPQQQPAAKSKPIAVK